MGFLDKREKKKTCLFLVVVADRRVHDSPTAVLGGRILVRNGPGELEVSLGERGMDMESRPRVWDCDCGSWVAENWTNTTS